MAKAVRRRQSGSSAKVTRSCLVVFLETESRHQAGAHGPLRVEARRRARKRPCRRRRLWSERKIVLGDRFRLDGGTAEERAKIPLGTDAEDQRWNPALGDIAAGASKLRRNAACVYRKPRPC
jgi:hypothetical protein